MATLSSTYLNLIDVHKANAPATGEVIEVLKRLSPVLDDAMAMECNNGTQHDHAIRTGLPTPAWGRLYKGTPQSKSTLQAVTDTTGFLEARSGVDTRVLARAKNPAQMRLSEARSHIEAMTQEMESGFFYHDTATTPEKFKGLAARYSATGGGGAGNQIVLGGGVGSDNTSIWFVTWGDHATHLLYPEGSKAGVQRDDKGEQRVLDANNDPFYVKEELFTWNIGVAVKDWRYNSRIANIDVSSALAGSTDLNSLMIDAFYKLQSTQADPESSRIAIYMNRGMASVLDKLGAGIGSAKNSALQLQRTELEGKQVMTWRGIPIRITDAILNTEALVA